MSETFLIRLATNADCKVLPDIAASAGRAFSEIGMDDVAGDAAPPATAWEPHCESGTLFVAVDEADRPFGFLAAGAQGALLFIYELAVAFDRQRQGAGRALIAAAEAKARQLDLVDVYLTTFCDVPFNRPIYAKLGYVVVSDHELPSVLSTVMAAERRRWSEPDRLRCAMRKELTS